ncbi:MarR family winged helix-turn-helix transcriptional regulator [Nocardia bovistercoris]|uniref:MarR family transcriptional regulator n=1 Tax=Nocardia bovistercoris TaxID=2785916 RepID=A0A931IH42_9NOCA|nr:MarR family transcriptional regulator [Nocardia bovistercoris]MBH0781319.1 MarR family transcriptional regulator [Nocardia bovistercoris]
MPTHPVNPSGLLRFPSYALGRLHKAAHAEIGSSLREHWVLVFLEEFDNLSQQQVSTALGIDRSEVVRLIDGLEEAGYVVRTRDADDRRKYCLSITRAGRAQRRRTDQLIEAVTARVFARLDDAERRTLHRLALKALGEDESLAD